VADAEDNLHKGRCFCGAVHYEARGVIDIWYCHCTQCRSLTGHYMAAACAERQSFNVDGDIRWVAVSDKSKHGFCAQCCSPLFWSKAGSDLISIVAGSLHDTTGIEVKGHIFVSEKGGYYDITDGLPQYERYPEDEIR